MDGLVSFGLVATIGVLAAIADLVHQKRTPGVIDPNRAMRWFRRSMIGGIAMFLLVAIIDLYLGRSLAH